ncbi:18303_t:CDS:2 [Rhizophagus irregularis]|nr:18303_t:CDS:2 [Rhizophagus irregularis]
MDKTIDEAIELFRSQKIPVFEPGEEEYERSVATPNLLFRFSRPHLVIQPETASHVQAIIKQARAQKLKITIKCGGHLAGPQEDEYGHARHQIENRHDGCRLHMGPRVQETGQRPAQRVHHQRSFGMGCDTLEEATVVTADGELVTVKDNDDPNSKEGKLFWALRGAGGGNFGVLVKMKLKVQQLQNKDGVVVAGRYQWFPNSGITNDLMSTMNNFYTTVTNDFMTTMNNFYTTDWPNQMTIDSTWMCDPQQKEGDGVRFLVYYDGNKDEFDTLIDKYIKQPELAKQLKRRSLPEKSTRFLHETLVAQWSEETTKAFPTNKTYNIYSSFVFNNDKISIEKVTAIIREEMKTFRRLYRGEKVQFLVTWIHSGGKAREKKPSDTAFFWREAVYHTYVTVDWEDKWMERDMRGFLKNVKKKLRPFSLKREAAFINFADGELSKKAHERAYFGNNRKELRRIKEIWDKDNFFKWTQGIQLPQGIDDDGELDVDVPDKEDMTDTIAEEQWEYFKTDDFVKDLKEFVDNVDKFVKEHPLLERFFKGKKNYIKELAQKAADLKNDPSTPLGSKDLLPKTIKVTLRQQVIYCDDSSSMKRDGRWDSQKRLVDRIAKITTRILPEGQGVALRFINQDVDNNSNLTLAEIRNILEPMSYMPGGNTEIGTYLRSKILEPLVYSKLESKSLERPLLISVITDGMPEGEKSSEFVDAILECGNKLEGAKCEVHGWPDRDGKGRGKVSGNHKKRHEDCRIDQLDAKFEEFHKNEGDLDRWLVETLYWPIKDSEDKEDHESDGDDKDD